MSQKSSKGSGNTNTHNTTTIKIAAKDPNQRTGSGAADPGPGDPSAAPSVAPQLVDIPSPPTPSELVVKSTATAASSAGMSGSLAGPAASHPSAAREPTSSRPLTGPGQKTGSAGSHKGPSLSHHAGTSAHKSGTNVGGSGASGSRSKSLLGTGTSSGAGPASSNAPKSGIGSGPKSVSSQRGAAKSVTHAPGASGASGVGEHSVSGAQGSGAPGAGPSAKPSSDGQAGSSPDGPGQEHDEDEEGEGELETPDEAGGAGSPSPSANASGAGGTGGGPAGSGPTNIGNLSGMRGSSAPSATGEASATQFGKAGSIDMSAPASSGNKFSTHTSGLSSGTDGADGKKKKVTKFRYHKRITVRTSGKTSPAAIMEKVNKKAHRPTITPSTIEDMDTSELMKRAGIKGSKQTHWRVRLRQTKRLTKNGKTTTQTKYAYRDSEGNKRVKTSSNPYCKTCGKSFEECKCETSSNSQN